MQSLQTRAVVEPLQLLNDETVYRRTMPGQREAIFMQGGLSPLERRLLLIVNGNSPLRSLLDLIDSHGDVPGALRRLFQLGMIELIPAA